MVPTILVVVFCHSYFQPVEIQAPSGSSASPSMEDLERIFLEGKSNFWRMDMEWGDHAFDPLNTSKNNQLNVG